MFLSFALFDSFDSTGKVESFLVFPTDAPNVVVAASKMCVGAPVIPK